MRNQASTDSRIQTFVPLAPTAHDAPRAPVDAGDNPAHDVALPLAIGYTCPVGLVSTHIGRMIHTADSTVAVLGAIYGVPERRPMAIPVHEGYACATGLIHQTLQERPGCHPTELARHVANQLPEFLEAWMRREQVLGTSEDLESDVRLWEFGFGAAVAMIDHVTCYEQPLIQRLVLD